MMLSLLLSRILGIVREIIINHQFGQNAATDAYRLAFQIPDLIFYLVAGGALTSAFIPVFSEYLHTDRERDAWHVFSSVVSLMGLILIALIAVLWVAAPQVAHAMTGAAMRPMVPEIAAMSRIVLPAQFAFFIGGLLMGTLYARQVFSVPGLSPNIYNLGIIFGALVISRFVEPSVAGMTWGALFGAMLGSLIIPGLVLRRIGASYRFVLDTRHEGVRKVFRLMLPVVLGLSLPGIFPMIMNYFGSQFGRGVVSSYANSNQLMQAPLGVFGQSLALAAFPALAQFFAQQRMDQFQSQLARTIRQALYLSIPVAVLFIVMPTPVIRAMFEYGKFSADATERTAMCLRMYAIGIPAWCIQPILMRGYFSLQRPVPPIVMGTVTTLAFSAACAVSVKAGYGYAAMPFLGSAAAFGLAAAMLLGMRRELGEFDLAGVLATAGKSTIAAAGAALVLVGASFLVPLVEVVSRLATVLFVAAVGLVFAWGYFFVTRRLGMTESDYVARALGRNRRVSQES